MLNLLASSHEWKLSGLPPNYVETLLIINCTNISAGIFSFSTWMYVDSSLTLCSPLGRFLSHIILSVAEVMKTSILEHHFWVYGICIAGIFVGAIFIRHSAVLKISSSKCVVYVCIVLIYNAHIMASFMASKWCCSEKYIYSSVISPFIFPPLFALLLPALYVHHDVPLPRWENHTCMSHNFSTTSYSWNLREITKEVCWDLREVS